MNVNLIYEQMGYNLQISQFTPLSFLYEVASKVFKLSQKGIELYYKSQIIACDQTLCSKYFQKFPIAVNIINIEKKLKHLIRSEKKLNTNITKSEFLAPKTTKKTKKKSFVKCLICGKKNAIIYCRECNQFICFECNVRYPEHFGHNKISLESGDLILCFEEYRNLIIKQIGEINNAFKYSSENIITNEKRTELFLDLISTLKELDKKTQTLTIMESLYKCSADLLNRYNNKLKEMEIPKYREDVVTSFSEINENELEIKNYVPFINLQIVKSKFNIKMNLFFKETKELFDSLMYEINNKLQEALDIKDKTYGDIISYNREKYGKENLSESESSYSSSSQENNEEEEDLENKTYFDKQPISYKQIVANSPSCFRKTQKNDTHKRSNTDIKDNSIKYRTINTNKENNIINLPTISNVSKIVAKDNLEGEVNNPLLKSLKLQNKINLKKNLINNNDNEINEISRIIHKKKRKIVLRNDITQSNDINNKASSKKIITSFDKNRVSLKNKNINENEIKDSPKNKMVLSLKKNIPSLKLKLFDTYKETDLKNQ